MINSAFQEEQGVLFQVTLMPFEIVHDNQERNVKSAYQETVKLKPEQSDLIRLAHTWHIDVRVITDTQLSFCFCQKLKCFREDFSTNNETIINQKQIYIKSRLAYNDKINCDFSMLQIGNLITSNSYLIKKILLLNFIIVLSLNQMLNNQKSVNLCYGYLRYNRKGRIFIYSYSFC